MFETKVLPRIPSHFISTHAPKFIMKLIQLGEKKSINKWKSNHNVCYLKLREKHQHTIICTPSTPQTCSSPFPQQTRPKLQNIAGLTSRRGNFQRARTTHPEPASERAREILVDLAHHHHPPHQDCGSTSTHCTSTMQLMAGHNHFFFSFINLLCVLIHSSTQVIMWKFVNIHQINETCCKNNIPALRCIKVH